MSAPASARPPGRTDRTTTINTTNITTERPSRPERTDRTADAWSRAEQLLAVAACVVLGAQVPLTQQVGSGVVLALVLAPLWLRALRRYTWGAMPLALGTAALLSGWVLTEYARASHATSTASVIGYSLLFLSLITGIGVLLWARTLVGRGAAVWFGLGLLVHAAITPATPNLWKYTLSVPVVVVVLGLAAWRRSRLLEGLGLVVLVVVSAGQDSRSLAAMLAMALALVVWQVLRGWLRLRSTALRTLLTVGLLGTAIYASMQALILDGYLGEVTRERTLQQIDASGTLITGGRPELGASTALIANRPWGYGSGTLPTLNDILVAKSGMSSLNYDPNNGYVEQYLFGQGFEVHSVLADLWIHFGVPGTLFSLALVVTILAGTSSRIATGTASALVLFLAVQTVWDQLFSPFYTETLAVLTLAVALTAVRRRPDPHPSGSEPPARPDDKAT